MGTTIDKLSYLTGIKEKIAEKIIDLGGDITDNTTFREYTNELQTVYNNAPKVNAEGSNIELENCAKGKMVIQPKGNTKLLLPDEYQQVEYIESTGTQYIDTGYIPVQGDNIKINNFNLTNNFIGTGAIISAGTGDYQYIILIVTNQDKTYNRWFSSNSVAIDNGTLFSNSTIELTNDIFRIDNKSVSNVSYAGDVNTTLNIFRRANETNYIKASFSEIIIKNGEVIKRHYIPCYRKSDNEIGLYDLVTNTFFTNAGSGTFLKGEDYQTIKNVTGNNKVKVSGKNLAWNGWAEDFVDRINDNNKARLETFDNRNCLYYRADTSYPRTDTNYLFKINWKENTQYTFSFELYPDDNNKDNASLNLGILYTDGTYVENKYFLIPDITLVKKQWQKIKITTSTNKTIEYLNCNFASGFDYIDLDTFMVEESSIATEYESYIEPIEKELNLKSKNLFNKDNIEVGNLSDSDGSIFSTNFYVRTKDFILVKPDTDYYFTLLNTDVFRGSQLFCFDKNKEFISRRQSIANNKITTPSNCYYIKATYSYSTQHTQINFNTNPEYLEQLANSIQIEESSTATEYEPYYNYTLMKDDYITEDCVIHHQGTTETIPEDTTLYNQVKELYKTIIQVPTINIETESEEDNAQLIVNASALKQ